MDDVGHDGHPKKGGFLPPVPFRYRMWAAGKTEFLNALPDDGPVERVSTIDRVTAKAGKTGPLVFVDVDHAYHAADRLCLKERQTIVYKEVATTATPRLSSAPEHAIESVKQTDPVLLFRYSALTFNGHRIHYDAPYAIGEEGYHGIVVHGPLIATWLMQLAHEVAEREGKMVAAFSFRGVSPAIAGDTIVLAAWPTEDGMVLEARGEDRRIFMQANATVHA